MSSFSGIKRWHAISFSINTKGYLGTGTDFINVYKDFWEFDPNGNGVNEINLENLISVYPNPTKADVQISGLADVKIKSVEVFSSTGGYIHSHISTSAHPQIDLSSEPDGVYFLKINTDKGVATKKILLNK